MMAVRACYQIYLYGGASAAPLCPRRKLAHSALSEILMSIFGRMEEASKKFVTCPIDKMQEKDEEYSKIDEGSSGNDDAFESSSVSDESDIIRCVIGELIDIVEKLSIEVAPESRIFNGSRSTKVSDLSINSSE
ncbi:hypothetical protein BVRB_035850, partial [Beta vulgaris subsp. vulgaris]